MWISKKKYNELIAERDNYNKIASETIQLNGRVIDSNARILEEMKGVQELNHCLQQRNEELLDENERLEGIARRAVSEKDEMIDECLEMKAKLDAVCEERDRYKEQVEAFEEGKCLVWETE